MKKQTKKGFTIVELVIVIALIAILAAVLIPTFSNVINNAHESSDMTMVKNLNTILNTEETKAGSPAQNMSEAIAQAREGGYNVDKLTPTSSGDILWDQTSNRFVLVNAKREIVFKDESATSATNETLKDPATAYTFWKITSDIDADRSKDYGYSWYLADNYKGAKVIENATSGIDVGNNADITVTYANNTEAAKTVLLRTNGSTLTVNAPADTVKHFGMADQVVIDAVAENSYHAFGEIKAITVKSGRVVVEKEANVKVVIAQIADGATVKIEAHDEELKVYAPDDVVTGEAKRLGEVDEKTAENLITGVQAFAGGSGTEADPFLIATKEQAMEIENNSGYFKLINDITVEDEVYMSGATYVFDLNGHSITLKYGDGVKPNNGSVLYIGGKGGNLTINDSSEAKTGSVYGSKEKYSSKVTSAVRTGNYGTLTINGGNFYGMSEGTSCIYTFGNSATVSIYGGRFETESPYNGTYYVLNHEDGTNRYKASAGSTMTVYGGTFVKYNPGTTVVDPVNAGTGVISLAEGYEAKAVTIDGKECYVVQKTVEQPAA